MRRFDTCHPVPERFVDGVFQRAAPRMYGPYFGAEQAHPKNVELLALHIDFAHVDDAFEPEEGGGGSCGDPVLAGACFGHEPLLSHFKREEPLAYDVVYLVAAGVVQVLALQQDPYPQFVREVAALS